MSVPEIKQALIEHIGQADEKTLKVMLAFVEAILSSEEDGVMGYDAHGNPKSVNEAKHSLDKELKAAKEGKYISLTELRNRSEKWLNGTK